jgi:plastocyanin
MLAWVSPLLRCGIVVSLPALLILWTVGCGPGEGGQEEVESEVEEIAEGPIDTIEVDETEFGLDPDDITLNRPGTYVFRAMNSGDVVHALEIEGHGIEEETPNIQPGESSELEVNLDPGTYELYCPVDDHEKRGMMGTVTVKEG